MRASARRQSSAKDSLAMISASSSICRGGLVLPLVLGLAGRARRPTASIPHASGPGLRAGEDGASGEHGGLSRARSVSRPPATGSRSSSQATFADGITRDVTREATMRAG